MLSEIDEFGSIIASKESDMTQVTWELNKMREKNDQMENKLLEQEEICNRMEEESIRSVKALTNCEKDRDL